MTAVSTISDEATRNLVTLDNAKGFLGPGKHVLQ